MLPSPQAGDGPVETKTPGQIACDAYHGSAGVWRVLTPSNRKLWERCAAALATPAAVAVPEEVRRLSEAATQGICAALRYQDDLGGAYLDIGGLQVASGLTEEDADFIAASVNHCRPLLATPPSGRAVEGGETWTDLDPAEIVRRTRCEADNGRGLVQARIWRECCDAILQRLPAPAPPASAGDGVAEDEIDIACRASWEAARPFIAAELNGGADPGDWDDQPQRHRAVSRIECRAALAAVDAHRALAAAPTPEPAEGGEREIVRQRADILLALEAALVLLGRNEPGDSRAVSDEFVAMASAVAGRMNDDGRRILLSIMTGPLPTPADAEAREGR